MVNVNPPNESLNLADAKIRQETPNPTFDFKVIDVEDIQAEANKLANETTGEQPFEPRSETPPQGEPEPDELDKLIQSTIINPDADVSEPPTVISIGGIPVCTLGNFTIIKGKKKCTKTFYTGAEAAAAISGKCNIEVIEGSMPPNSTVHIFDNEQSQYHATRSIKRIIRQANSKNFTAYGLRPFKAAKRVEIINRVISKLTTPAFIIIDGLRDLMTKGINDEAEATEVTELLLAWTANKNCHIVLVLHENKNDTNARGHIGTEVTNKAESIIRIEKKGNLIEVTGECRDIDFEPFQYQINNEGLPEMVFRGDVKGRNKHQAYYDCFIAIIPGMVSMRYTELVAEYLERAGVKEATAKRHIAEALKLKVIYKDGYSNYRVTQVEGSTENTG